MRTFKHVAVLLVLTMGVGSLCVYGASTETLKGTPGSAPQWGWGWLDLEKAKDFKKGDKLRLTIGGGAKNIFVRLLPDIRRADAPVGIVGNATPVPPNRVIEVSLTQDHPGVQQISVHGGPHPWGRDLGGGNGNATLEKVELIRP